LKKLGGSLEKSQFFYEESVKQLSSGKGNLLKRVEDLKQLGIKTEKQLALPAEDEYAFGEVFFTRFLNPGAAGEGRKNGQEYLCG